MKSFKLEILLFLAIIIVYIFLYSYVFSNNYLPNGSDECIYFNSAKMFMLNNSLKAPFTYNGEGAILFGGDCHGFAYALIYGFIMKLIGGNSSSYIGVNLFFTLLTLLLIFINLKFNLRTKLFLSLFILLSLNTLLFSFTYMPEAINIFLSVMILIQVYNIFTNPSRLNIFIFLLFIIFAGLFRPTYYFYSIMIVPFSKSRKDYYFNIILFVLFIVLGILYSRVQADNSVEIMAKIIHRFYNGEYIHAVLGVGWNFINNLLNYMFSLKEEPSIAHIIFRYINIFAIIYLLINGIRKKNKLFIAFSSAIILHHVILMTLHGIHGYGVIRHLFPTYLFFVFSIVQFSYRSIYKNILLILILFLFVLGFMHSYKLWIQYRIEYSNKYISSNLYNDFNNITDYISEKDDVVIFIDYIEYDGNTMNSVPLLGKSGNQIRYVMRYYQNNFNPQIIDYVITRPFLPPGNFEEIRNLNFNKVYSSENYDFYKVLK